MLKDECVLEILCCLTVLMNGQKYIYHFHGKLDNLLAEFMIYSIRVKISVHSTYLGSLIFSL